MKQILHAVAGASVAGVVTLIATSAMAFPFFHPRPGPGPTSVPEIDGSGAATAAAIVLGGAAVILSRRKQRS